MCALSHAHSRMQCSSEVGSHSRSDSDNDVKTEGSAFRIDPESERKSNKNKQTNAHSLIHAHMHIHTHIDISSSSKEVIPLNLRIRVLLYMGACRYANITYQIRTECTHAGGRASERAHRAHTKIEHSKNGNGWMLKCEIAAPMCVSVCVHVFQIDLQAEMRAYSSAAAAQQLLRLGYTPALHLSFYWCHLCKSTEMMNVMHSVIHIARDRDRDRVRMTLT